MQSETDCELTGLTENNTGWGLFLTPPPPLLHCALTQRAHYYQQRVADPRRHSYEGCLKALLHTHSPSVNDY